MAVGDNRQRGKAEAQSLAKLIYNCRAFGRGKHRKGDGILPTKRDLGKILTQAKGVQRCLAGKPRRGESLRDRILKLYLTLEGRSVPVTVQAEPKMLRSPRGVPARRSDGNDAQPDPGATEGRRLIANFLGAVNGKPRWEFLDAEKVVTYRLVRAQSNPVPIPFYFAVSDPPVNYPRLRDGLESWQPLQEDIDALVQATTNAQARPDRPGRPMERQTVIVRTGCLCLLLLEEGTPWRDNRNGREGNLVGKLPAFLRNLFDECGIPCPAPSALSKQIERNLPELKGYVEDHL